MVLTTSKVTVNVKDDQGKEKTLTQNYSKPNFEGTEEKDGKVVGGDPETLLEQAIGYFQEKYPKDNGLLVMLSHLTYGHDLKLRAPIGATMRASAAGPNLEATAKKIMADRAAIGKPITMEQAMAKAKMLLEEDF